MSDFNDPPPNLGRPIVERRDPRRAVKAAAVIRNNFQGRIGGQVIDISEHGCKLELGNERGQVGDKVTIKLGTFESWPGVIRWVNGCVVGVEFAAPLHSSVVDHLGSQEISLQFA